MRKSGQYFLLSKKLEKWFPKSAIFHRSSIPSIDNRMRYSFDAIDIKGISDRIKTYTRQRLQDGASYMQITAQIMSNECNKKEVVDIDKKSIACNCVSHKLLMYPIEDNCCKR